MAAGFPPLPRTNDGFSATAYFFARELRKELKVPVGIIKCAWGGTRVEAWIPADAYGHDKDMAAFLKQEREVLKKAIAKWDPKKVKEGNRRRAPKSPESNQQAPATLFNGMAHPVVPYAIKGAIWYQGESNTKDMKIASRYAQYFQAMITGWRKHWGQGDFPSTLFSWQPSGTRLKNPWIRDPWATVIDQQRRTLSLKNTGMAVLNDIGEAKDIHPHNKIDVASASHSGHSRTTTARISQPTAARSTKVTKSKMANSSSPLITAALA